MMMERCDIIIPVWNELDATKECLDSIKKKTRYPYRIIIIDNGSDRPTADYLDSLSGAGNSNIKLIRNKENIGFVKAANQGIRESSAPYLCILNNDTVVTERWLEEMIAVMEAHPEIGIVNPSSNTFGQKPHNQSIDDYALSRKQDAGRIQELYYCKGFCILMRRDVVTRLGPFDESYQVGYFEETDYSERAEREGFKIARAKGAYVYHKENVSFRNLAHNNALFESNQKIFQKKWGRKIRVAYLVASQEHEDKISDIALGIARSGHQILIFIKKGLRWPVATDHWEIRKLVINPFFFALFSIYKILKRKKKKHVSILLTDDAIFGEFLKFAKALHGADVVINPDKGALLKLLETKSTNGTGFN